MQEVHSHGTTSTTVVGDLALQHPVLESTDEPSYISVYEGSQTPESAPSEQGEESGHDDSDYVERPTIRCRRTTSRATGRQNKHRINKITPAHKTLASSRRATVSSDNDTAEVGDDDHNDDGNGCFLCPLASYGCRATFGSKNEWKRHFSTQHMRLSFWRCDQCSCANGRKPNDFNRKDLFMQHVRRMHIAVVNDSSSSSSTTSTTSTTRASPKRKSPAQHKKPTAAEDQQALDAATRCFKQVRSPPTKSSCLVCAEVFTGKDSWEKRVEHLGKHFEQARRASVSGAGGKRGKTNIDGDVADILQTDKWHVDDDVERWMIREGILHTRGDGSVTIHQECRE